MTRAIISALGAVTSVGFDAATTCASIRAGLSRPQTIEEHEVLDRREQAPVGVNGHPISLVAGGFCGVGRWLQLAAAALEDLGRSGHLPEAADQAFWSTTLCYVVTPILDVPRYIMHGACASDATVEAKFIAPLKARLSDTFAPERVVLLSRGRAGVLEAIRLADEHFAKGRYERVIVLAVDSLTDAVSLDWLSAQDRLKDDDHPVGLSPGEAAVAFMIELSAVASRRGAEALGRVLAITTGTEPEAWLIGGRSIGEALARVTDQVLVEARVPLPYGAPTLTDLNGESWRAEEFGHARVRVSRHRWASDDVDLPASSVGDIGAVMPALQVAIACRSFIRGYAHADHVLMTSSDEYGNVGAAIIGRGD